MQQIDAAFVHILRNCLDHGIEEIEKRRADGKPPFDTIQVAFHRRPDGWLHFVITDDGSGVNADKLAEKAVSGGIWTAEQAHRASYQDKVDLVFVPKLSSKDEVSELSGRGVGMDAVKTLVEELGGSISIRSRPGHGTQFELSIPPLGKAPTAQDGRPPNLVAV